MRIGILETDTLDADIREKYGSYAEMFQQLFLVVNNRLKFKVYRVIEGNYPDNMQECDAFIITGSKFSAYDNKAWIIKLREYIVKLNRHKIKLIGICFGHQIIAQALGGGVEKSEKGWGVGNTISDIKKIKPWMNNRWMNNAGMNKTEVDKAEENNKEIEKFSLLVSHQDQVTRLPGQAECIAGNSFCENASFQMENHILTFQGHPEFSSEYLTYLMNKRRALLGDEKYKHGLESLHQRADAQLVAQWMLNFCLSK